MGNVRIARERVSSTSIVPFSNRTMRKRAFITTIRLLQRLRVIANANVPRSREDDLWNVRVNGRHRGIRLFGRDRNRSAPKFIVIELRVSGTLSQQDQGTAANAPVFNFLRPAHHVARIHLKDFRSDHCIRSPGHYRRDIIRNI
jgi:hypothetical protein